MKELYIKGKQLELDNSEPIALTFQVNDIAELADRQASFSNSFIVPLSNLNKTILGNSDTVSTNSVRAYRLNETKYINNGIEIIPNGISYIDEINTNNNTCNLTIMSGILDFFTKIENKSLKDLFSGSTKYDHTWNTQTAYNFRNNTSGIVYPFANFGRPQTASNVIDIQYTPPCMYVSTLVNEIFAQAGYSYTGKLFSDPFFNSLVVSLTDNFQRSPDWIKARTSKVAIDSTDHDIPTGLDYVPYGIERQSDWNEALPLKYDYTFTVPHFPSFTDTPGICFAGVDGLANNFNSSDYSYTADKAMNVTVGLNVGIYVQVPNAGAMYFKFSLFKNGNLIQQYEEGNIHSSSDKRIFPEVSWNVDLLPGDRLTMNYEGGKASGFGTNTHFFIFLTQYTYVTITPNDTINIGSDISIIDAINDIKQKDFIKGLAQMFGLIFQANNITNQMQCVQFKEIPQNLQVDWSNKIDLSQDITLRFRFDKYSQNNTLTYTPSDSNLSATVNNIGNGSFKADDNTLTISNNLFQLPFTASTGATFNGISNVAYIPLWKNDNSNWSRQDIGFRIFAISQVTNPNQTDWTINDTITSDITTSTYPYIYFIDDSKPHSLSFGNDLIANNYTELISSLQKCKIVRAYFNLSPVDIQNLDFFKPIYVSYFGQNFYLNRVEQYQENKTTLCELVRL